MTASEAAQGLLLLLAMAFVIAAALDAFGLYELGFGPR